MQFLGIEWHTWKVIGWLGNLAFSLRFFVQWYATEKTKQVVIPPMFWWLSLVGSMFLLSYAIFYQKDSVFIFAYAFTWIPYIRNLIIQRRVDEAQVECLVCKTAAPPKAKFCPECGEALLKTERASAFKS
ncbi:MAG TPA: lipid-A-disaccharide synthase N-terminal domain-containing protein [Methylomirabilota bacterium]|nr:lipid-A-disaccharide synthase N-terminal domain-containing protein [Methylomirabilota bacterium]